MCAAPAMALCFVRPAVEKNSKLRWATIGFLVLTNLVIDGNVAINNTFRGLWHFTENKPWPYDWLLFPKSVIEEIQRAKKIHIAITHGKVYYFSFMHWNPGATYYSPYEAPPSNPNVLHILSTPSESYYGFMPIRVPFKPTAGITYLGHIRGVDREEVFAFGNDVAMRHPTDSDFISLHASLKQGYDGFDAEIDPIAAGLNSGDRLEFQYRIRTLDKHTVYESSWQDKPALKTELPKNSMDMWTIDISIRSAVDTSQKISTTFALGAKGAWRITRPGEDPNASDDD
jgi:hypothetical protein